jgi:hypothetical protein
MYKTDCKHTKIFETKKFFYKNLMIFFEIIFRWGCNALIMGLLRASQ